MLIPSTTSPIWYWLAQRNVMILFLAHFGAPFPYLWMNFKDPWS